MKIAEEQKSTKVVEKASCMIPIVEAEARGHSWTFQITDDFTTRLLNSTNQMSFLLEKSDWTQEFIKKLTCGGQLYFKNQQMLEEQALSISEQFHKMDFTGAPMSYW